MNNSYHLLHQSRIFYVELQRVLWAFCEMKICVASASKSPGTHDVIQFIFLLSFFFCYIKLMQIKKTYLQSVGFFTLPKAYCSAVSLFLLPLFHTVPPPLYFTHHKTRFRSIEMEKLIQLFFFLSLTANFAGIFKTQQHSKEIFKCGQCEFG